MARRLAVTLIAAIAALVVVTPANTYPFFDWAWGYPNAQQFHQNRWWTSDSVLQREQVYIKLDRCLPVNARLRVAYITTSGWFHKEKVSAFGACNILSSQSSNGPSRVTFRIEYWNCAAGIFGPDCSHLTSPQGDCFYNIVPNTGCPSGVYVDPYATYKWYRLPEAWAYTNMLGCGDQAQCQMRPLNNRTARAE